MHPYLEKNFSTVTIAKAYKLEEIVRDEARPTIYTVNGRYRTEIFGLAGEYAGTCSCLHGQNNSPAHCYHVAAAFMAAERDGLLPAIEQEKDDEFEDSALDEDGGLDE